MILLWGLTGDGPFDAVRTALTRRGATFTVIDQRLVRLTSVDLNLAGQLTGTVDVGGEHVRLEEVDAAYWRTYDMSRLPALAGDGADADSEALHTAWALESAMVAWLELTDARVINPASAMASNNSKPFQLNILRSHGFSVPRRTGPDLIFACRRDIPRTDLSGLRASGGGIGSNTSVLWRHDMSAWSTVHTAPAR